MTILLKITNLKVMKKVRLILPLLMLGLVYVGVTSCRKKVSGNCYCSYFSGDKTHYDLGMLPTRTAQEDSCNLIDHNASAFAGDCKLK